MSKTMAEIDAEYQEAMDAKPLTVRCGLCPWVFEGTAGEARAAQFEHRKTHVRGAAAGDQSRPPRFLSQGTTAADRRAAAAKHADPDEPAAAADTPAGETTTQEETPMPPCCKIDGCEHPRQDRAGRYGGLCATHKQEARDRFIADRDAAAAQTAAGSGQEPGPAAPPTDDESSPPLLPAGNLVHLAELVEQAEQRVADARAALAAAEREREEALLAVLEQVAERRAA